MTWKIKKKGKKESKTDAKARLSFWAAVSSALMSDCTMDCKKKTKTRKKNGRAPALLLGRDHAVDGLALLQLLLHLDHQLDAINHALHLLNLWRADTVSVGNVKHSTNGSGVHTTWENKWGWRSVNGADVNYIYTVYMFKQCLDTCATLLQAQSGQDLLKLGMCAQLGQLDVDTTTQACAQVGGAGQNETKMLVPHESMVVLLENLLDLSKQNIHMLTFCGQQQRFSYVCLCVQVLHTLWRPTQKRLNTSFMLPPCCMEMTRRWSSSFTQTRKVLFSLCL